MLLQKLASLCSVANTELENLLNVLSREEQMLPFDDPHVREKTGQYRKTQKELMDTVAKLGNLLEL